MNEKSILLLNKAVSDELYAVHQYLYFHFHCDNQGMDLLANLFKRTAIAEMGHVEKLSERILFLKGDVDMNIVNPIQKIKSMREMLKLACALEQESIKEYNEWARESSANADAVTRQLFEELIAEEEKHFDQFDIELSNIDKFGDGYLALQSIERSKIQSSGK